MRYFTFGNSQLGAINYSKCPPNGQGITALLALGILESAQEKGIINDLLKMEHNSAEYLHALVEALRCVTRLS